MRTRRLTPFGIKVRKKLIDMGKTQVWLAKEVGTTRIYLNQIFYGERSGEMYLPRIITVLGLEDDANQHTA